MKTATILLNKTEAFPIGDVLGLVVVWMENDKAKGELFFTRQNNQGNIFKERVSILKKDWKYFNIEKDLISRIKRYHKDINVLPEVAKLPATGLYAGFNPFEEDRFKWQEVSWKEIYIYLESYSAFFEEILKKTEHEELKKYIEFNKRIKGSIVFETIE